MVNGVRTAGADDDGRGTRPLGAPVAPVSAPCRAAPHRAAPRRAVAVPRRGLYDYGPHMPSTAPSVRRSAGVTRDKKGIFAA